MRHLIDRTVTASRPLQSFDGKASPRPQLRWRPCPRLEGTAMRQFLPQRAATRASLIVTAAMGALMIVIAVGATTAGPVLVWFLGLFVVVLLWLATRR